MSNHNDSITDIEYFTELFFHFEEKHSLFEKEKNSIFYWDIIRYHIFYSIYFKKCGIEIDQNGKKSDNVLIRKLQSGVGILRYFFQLRFAKRRKYLFFTASRNVHDRNRVYDVNSYDVIKLLKEENIRVIETFSDKETVYKSVRNYGLAISIKWDLIRRIFYREKKWDFKEISDLLNIEFDTDIDFNKEMSDLLIMYSIQYRHYKSLFKKLRPQTIFTVQNGVQKAMFAAANSLAIPIVEIQHGLINRYHPSYSYPIRIKTDHLKSLPKYFFSYSNFWTENLNYPVFESIAIGNSIMSSRIPRQEKKFSLVILYADGYDVYLKFLLLELISVGFKEPICIKLHPSMFNRHEEVVDEFRMFPFIEVVKNESSIEDLLSRSLCVVAIQSTVVYQALHNDIPVFIYKRSDYKIHADVFDNSLVFLVNRPEDIVRGLEVNYDSICRHSKKFFKDFNPNIVESFIAKTVN